MKRLVMFIGAILLACLGLFTLRQAMASTTGGGKDTLIIYNWGDYIDPDIIASFEEESGYKVIYETFDSNEAMYTKIKQGGTKYDIAVPSDYTIEKMIEEDLLIPLDHSKIEGLDHIEERFLNLPFDKGNRYSIPYFWGTLGIVYNEKFVDGSLLTKWSDLWRPEFANSELLIDGAREMVGLTLQSQGYSLNERDTEIVTKAGARLKELMGNAKAIIADEIKMYMAQEEAHIAVTFSGEAATMMEQNENLVYVIPEEGTNLWFDNLVIPKTSGNTQGAYDFINYINRPEIAAQNAEYIGYATPNQDAVKLLPEEITSDESFYPKEEQFEHMEVYENLGPELLGLYNDQFLEAKMYRK